MTERPLAAVVLAAGKGTRMRSELPKVLHPLLGLPLLAYPLNAMLLLDVRPCVVVVGYGAEQVRSAFSSHHLHPRFVVQAEQLGTGHATLQAASSLQGFIGEVLILPADAPLIQVDTLRAFLAYHRTEQADLSVLTTSLELPGAYGRIVRDAQGALECIVEARDASPEVLALREINSGIYLASSELLFSALARVGNANAQGEYYLTDIVEIARRDGCRLRAHCHPLADELAGINDRVQLAEAEQWLSEHINTRWMLAGVTLEHPGSTRIEAAVSIEQDVHLEGGVVLKGQCRIARGCRIERGAVLSDVTLGPGSQVGAYAVLSGLELGAQSRVPPLTHRASMGRR